MTDVERRFLPMSAAGIHIEERDDGSPVISGIASVFYDGTPRTEYQPWPGVVERIMPTAFDKAMKPAKDEDTVALFNHNPDHILGRRSAKTLRLRRKAEGLGYFIDVGDTTVAQDVRKHIERGDLTGSSFSFIIDDYRWHLEDGVEVREIHSAYPLFDVGPVTFPAYKATSVSARSEASLNAWRNAWREEREQAPTAEGEDDPEPEVRAEPREPEGITDPDAAVRRQADILRQRWTR